MTDQLIKLSFSLLFYHKPMKSCFVCHFALEDKYCVTFIPFPFMTHFLLSENGNLIDVKMKREKEEEIKKYGVSINTLRNIQLYFIVICKKKISKSVKFYQIMPKTNLLLVKKNRKK